MIVGSIDEMGNLVEGKEGSGQMIGDICMTGDCDACIDWCLTNDCELPCAQRVRERDAYDSYASKGLAIA
jgi:hypothetical protein